jgi:hypothetical protein
MVVEADLELLFPDRFPVDKEVAAPYHENVPYCLERGTDIFYVRVRTKIAGTVTPDLPGDEDARVRLPGDDDVGVTLVVLEADVVPGPELLDQVGFQYQRFNLGVGHDHLEVGRLQKHLLDAGAEGAGFLKILADPVPEVLRLPDIEDLSRRILVLVDAGSGREVFEFFGKCDVLPRDSNVHGGGDHCHFTKTIFFTAVLAPPPPPD